MLPIKRRFKSKGIDWKVKMVESDLSPGFKSDNGATDFENTTVFILKSLNSQVQWETLFHELFHIITWGYEKFDLTEEWATETLAGEMMSIARQLGMLD